MSELGKLGMFHLDELKRKPISNTKQARGVNIRIHKSKIQEIPTEKIPIQADTTINEQTIDEESISLEEKAIVIPKKGSITMFDERDTSNFDREKMLQTLNMRDIFSVKTLKLPRQMNEEIQQEIIDTVQEPSVDELKSIATPSDKMILEEEVEDKTTEPEDKTTEPEEKAQPRKIKIIRKVKSKEPVPPTKTFGHKDIQKSDLLDNKILPETGIAHRVRASPYYMANRKMYIQKLVPMFSKYKKMLTDEARKSSCDDKNESSGNNSFKLLVHQQVVRDYLNLYTPYRGLLLYHGLGSGKTCSSIAIAEGMKSERKVFVLTLASLKANFFDQMKVCGDPIYKLNQYWEFVSTIGQPDMVALLSRALDLPMEFINKHKGAWMVNVTKETNFDNLDDGDKKGLNAQIDEMIRSKYVDLNYNGGITTAKLTELTNNLTRNPFDNSVVIIDEVHNFVSRIVNKMKGKDKKSISYRLYEYLMSAENARIVLLSGTPIINYPNEIGILFNILRGYIKTWSFPIEVLKGADKPSNENILSWFKKDKLHIYDYVQYSGDHITITRNPFGFVNTFKNEHKGGKSPSTTTTSFTKKNTKKIRKTKPTTKRTSKKNPLFKMKNGLIVTEEKLEGSGLDETDEQRIERIQALQTGGGAFEDYSGVKLDETGNISDESFKQSVKRILEKHGLRINGYITSKNNLALPDTSNDFFDLFVGLDESEMKNKSVFQKRVLGLSSYFRGADESLYPELIPSDDGEVINIENIPMSEYQFSIYEKIRSEEAKREKKTKMAKQKLAQRGENAQELFKISSTYKIASRMACNFVFPNPPGRPVKTNDDDEDAGEEELKEDEIGELNLRGKKRRGGENSKDEDDDDDEEEEEEVILGEEDEGEKEEDKKDDQDKVAEQELIEYTGNYNKDIQMALMYLKMNEDKYLTPEGLKIYSPKFLKLLENIQNSQNIGLHLVYSQFRTLEGIGIFKLILEANGFAQFKIRKKGTEGDWEIVEDEKDTGKPKFALHTGTETDEEKKIILNIYNSKWKEVPHSIVSALRYDDKEHNHMGDVIKIMMITASGAEGINLKNTRFVHLVEPYWHNVRIEQVIGRARRICSHQDLPEELRTVQVFLYIAVLSETQATDTKHIELRLRDSSTLSNRMANEGNENTRLGRYIRKLGINPTVITTDQVLFEGAIRKEFVNTQILHAVKETAMDCQLYAGTNKDEPIVCYNYGVVKSNAFGSYPSLEKDVAEKDVKDTRENQYQIVKITDPKTNIIYALNVKFKILYDFEQYKRSLDTNETLVAIGKLVKDKSGNEVVKRF